MLLSNLGKIGDSKGQKPNIFLKCEGGGQAESELLPTFWRAHWVQVVRLSGLFPPLVVCSLPFPRFTALLLVRCMQMCLYLRF